MRKKLVLLMILVAALMALPAMAQSFGANQTEQPNAAFQSTSTMTGSGSQYSANPTLNSDGTAAYSNASYSTSSKSGPRRAKMEGEDEWGTNQEHKDVDEGSPLGDTLLPLLFMSLAFGMFVYFRRKRSAA